MKTAGKSLPKPIKLLLILTTFIFLVTPCLGSDGQKNPATSSAAPDPVTIPADTSCGVCGMFPARYPEWQTQIIFSDSKMVPFDGCKDMFKYLLNMAKFDTSHTRADVAVAWVKDFNNGTWLNAENVVYVVDSNQMGPMGKELIPFENQSAADKFQTENGGTAHSFNEITMEMVGKLGMGGMKMGKGHM